MKIGITADCSSGVEYAPFKHNIKITRTTINFEHETLIDGIDITAENFYKRLEKDTFIPSTSAPTIGEITKKVEEWKKEGCTDIIHFPISFGLSTYGENLIKMSDELFEGINFHVADTKEACIMEGYQAYYAEVLAAKGYSVEEILKECARLRDKTHAYFVVDDLKYLVKNGRLGGVSGLVGTVIQIKPILEINKEGKIVPFKKVRTHAKALEALIDLTINEGAKAKKVIYVVLHANRLELATKIKEKLEAKVKNASRVELTTITPTVGAHIGSGVIGMATIIVDDLKEEI